MGNCRKETDIVCAWAFMLICAHHLKLSSTKLAFNIPSSAKVAQSSNSIQSSSNMHTKSQGLHPLHWRLHFSVQQDSFRVGIYTIVACLHY